MGPELLALGSTRLQTGLSQAYKNPKVKDSKGEQTERKKEEEKEGASGGSPRLQAPQAQGREERGWDGPLRAPIPPDRASTSTRGGAARPA